MHKLENIVANEIPRTEPRLPKKSESGHPSNEIVIRYMKYEIVFHFKRPSPSDIVKGGIDATEKILEVERMTTKMINSPLTEPKKKVSINGDRRIRIV